MTECVYNSLLFRSSLQLSCLPNDWSKYVVKSGTYYLHYKEILIDNLSQTFVGYTNSLHFLWNYENLSVASLLIYNYDACIPESGLVTKKVELPRVILHLFSNALQFSSLILNSTLSKSTSIF